MKFKEIKDKNNDELKVMMTGIQSKLLKLNFDLADKKLKDTTQLIKMKRDIARILTVLNKQS